MTSDSTFLVVFHRHYEIDAARQMELDASYLSRQIKQGKKAYGFTWKYKEEI